MSWRPSEGDSRAGPKGRPLVTPEITAEGGSFQFFSFSVPLGPTGPKTETTRPTWNIRGLINHLQGTSSPAPWESTKGPLWRPLGEPPTEGSPEPSVFQAFRFLVLRVLEPKIRRRPPFFLTPDWRPSCQVSGDTDQPEQEPLKQDCCCNL